MVKPLQGAFSQDAVDIFSQLLYVIMFCVSEPIRDGNDDIIDLIIFLNPFTHLSKYLCNHFETRTKFN